MTKRQTSEASSTASTVVPTTPKSFGRLPQCGSLSTMDIPWSPASHPDRRADDEHDDHEELDEEDEEEPSEFVCYGDRLCLLCDGQLLALTRKFNLSYEQMALLATATIVSGGLLGIASFFIWQKGLFRKRYAALLSDLVYRDTPLDEEAIRRKLVEDDQMSSVYASHVTGLEKLDATMTSDDAKTTEKKAMAVTFRIFEVDPETHTIKYSSLGQPVQFGAPVIIAHAASRRAIRYQSHRGAVTISRPPRNPHFRKDVKDSVALIDASLASGNNDIQDDAKTLAAYKTLQHTRPKSLTTTVFHRMLGDRRPSSTRSMRSLSAHNVGQPKTLATAPPPASLGRLRTTTWSDPTMTGPQHSDLLVRRASQPPHFRELAQPQEDPTESHSAAKNLVRSISASCLTLVRNIGDSVQHKKERHALKKRRRLLLKNLPNMAFPAHEGQYFIARLQPPRLPLFRSQSDEHPKVPPVEEPKFLRWGAPMQLVADYNNHPCGFHSREYYRDAQQYMSAEGTECSPATIIPIPESGNLQAIAKESVRRVANMEKRQVKLRIGTYNVWMMPRKISMFANVSPKKNTRAKLIADVLPPCDVWVFTECFDHRARNVLLDKLKRSGGYYFNSPTVGHKRRGPDGRYLDKLLNGGVVLASKYPILSVRIKLFREISAGSDKFADKGVLYCKILKDGLLVHIFSTHLQAWNDHLSRSVRRQQLEIIAEMMQSMGIDEAVDCVLFVGDLNVNKWLNEENGEYDEMLQILDATDSGASVSKSGITSDFKRKQQFSFDGRLNPLASDGPSSDGSLELLDYVLYSKSHHQPSQAMSYVQPIFATVPWNWKKQPQYHLSDHFPVVSELTFDMWRA